MSRGCGVLFGLGWTAFSSIFVVVGLLAFWGGVKTHTWDEVPCQIQQFKILDVAKDDPPFKVELSYRYSVDGVNYTGTQLKPDFEGVDKYEDLAELEDEIYDGDDARVCWVNPDDPTDAVLFHGGGESWFGLIFVAFGGGFVVVGLGLIVAAIREGGPEKAVTEKKSGSGGDGKMSGLLGCGFFGVFAVAGLGILGGLVVPTAYRYFAVKSWIETPAEVVWSEVRRQSGEDGPTFRADIFYRYEFEGRSYQSNSYSLTGSTGSSGREKKQELVEGHPKGKQIVCFVNPKLPRQALLNRSLGWWALFALFPLPFAAIGLGGLYATFIRKEKPEDQKPKTGSASEVKVQGVSSPARKRSTVGKRLLHVLGALFLAAFWNGITSVFVWQVWEGWRGGDAPWFLTLFMLPFVAIGIGIIVHFFYRVIAVFSPIYQVDLGELTIQPGGRTSMSWRRRGGYGKPRRMMIWLVGREQATYRRGTDTTTSTELFHEELLFETEVSQMMPAGRCQVELPADAVPTFAGDHNKLQWFVILVADVPWQPDVRDEYEVVVQPSEGGYS